LHYLAICKKNKKIYLLSVQALSNFGDQKNPEFSHQTCKFVLRVEGQLFLVGVKVNKRKEQKQKGKKMKERTKRTSNIQRSTLNIECGAASRSYLVAGIQHRLSAVAQAKAEESEHPESSTCSRASLS